MLRKIYKVKKTILFFFLLFLYETLAEDKNNNQILNKSDKENADKECELIEEYIPGREIQVGVIDKKALVGFSWIDMPLYRVIVIKSERSDNSERSGNSERSDNSERNDIL